MSALLKQYFDIAFLMGKPEDLPQGNSQLYVAIVLNFLTYVLALVSFVGVGAAMMRAALDIGITSGVLYFALNLRTLLPRLQQSLGAICGAGAVLNLAAIPMLQLTEEPAGEPMSVIGIVAQFVLLVWSLSLVGHVIRHTFEVRLSTSIVAAVLYYLFIINVFGMVFPETSTN